MTFISREISLTLQLADGTLNDEGSNVINLTGHRCEAIIENPGGNLNLGSMQLRIYGMKVADMNRFSTNHLHTISVRNDVISLSAGDSVNGVKKVFDGTIASACVNYSGMPEVAFDIFARSGMLYQVKPAAANTYQGEVDVATIVGALAKQMGYAFQNNGVSIKLSNQYLHGTLIDQLTTVCEAARIPCSIANNTVTIWPNDGSVAGDTIMLSPQSGLVGYPTFTRNGVLITNEFRPELAVGRKVNLSTSVEKAQGDWYVQNLRHELSTVQPQGAWFSVVNLAPPGFYVSRI